MEEKFRKVELEIASKYLCSGAQIFWAYSADLIIDLNMHGVYITYFELLEPLFYAFI